MIRFAGLGHAGLALSTSAVALFGFVVLFAILRRRIGGVHGRDLAVQIGKVSLASAIMGAAIFATSRGMEMWLGDLANGAAGGSGRVDSRSAWPCTTRRAGRWGFPRSTP